MARIESPITKTSPQNMAFQWLLEDPAFNDYTEERIVQRFALATLFYSSSGGGGSNLASSGEGWFNDENWLSYQHECEWWAREDSGQYADNDRTILQYDAPGGPCGDEGQEGVYQHLWLWGNRLQGTLPLELYLLAPLRSIALTSNQLGGTLSTHIGKLSHLEALALQGNSLTGPLPDQLYSLTNLTGLFLFNNNFDGTISADLSNLSLLKYLLLDDNSFNGSIPKGLDALQNLEWLYLDKNDFTGTIPTDIFAAVNQTITPKLELVNFAENLLTG